jgi:hypothetical protein
MPLVIATKSPFAALIAGPFDNLNSGRLRFTTPATIIALRLALAVIIIAGDERAPLGCGGCAGKMKG